ncbi:MAG TPA: RT0821/Lpp0805 family surface protein [Stellaceae bacterium]|nr:RT0821/Lpp0805 family surface protein [Stellaceae bacterium]
MRKFVTVIALVTALGACTQTGGTQPGEFGINNTTGGTLLGAGLGGLLGNQFGGGAGKGLMTAAGVVAGGLIGHSIGSQLDQADKQAMSRTTQTALETGRPDQPLPWRNQDSGHSGTVIPGRYYQTAQGTYCREYQETIDIGGQMQQGYGTACRQPDGSWKIVPR